MKLKLRHLRALAFGLLLGFLVIAPFHRADGRIETVEQAQADAKLFAQEMEMQRESKNLSTNDPSTLKKLGELKLDHVRWGNIDVQTVLNELTVKSKAADPDHTGLDFVLKLPADMKQTDKLGRVINNNVCIIVDEKKSFYDLLMLISEQTNLAFGVQKGTVILRLWEPGDCISFLIQDE